MSCYPKSLCLSFGLEPGVGSHLAPATALDENGLVSDMADATALLPIGFFHLHQMNIELAINHKDFSHVIYLHLKVKGQPNYILHKTWDLAIKPRASLRLCGGKRTRCVCAGFS